MRIEAFAIRLRERAPLEAADLGVRLCQHSAAAVFRCYAVVFLPVAALSLASFEIAAWLPTLLLWLSKPWLDRTIVFVLSRAAFGQTTTLGDLWGSQRQVWWSQLPSTWTLRRLSPWRSFTQPVHQLEGLDLLARRRRVLQLRRNKTTPPLLMTSAFGFAEMALAASLFSLVFWLAPQGMKPDLGQLYGQDAGFIAFASSMAYAVAVAFIEPFYVAAGFAMYLNRRVELEAWDIEQEFRRAFAS